LQEADTRFPRSARLLKPEEFKQVFKQSRRTADAFFTILFRPNGLPQARLGMAIAKKNLKLAVDRNLVKRTVRESFRYHQEDLSGFDLVVMCRKGLPLDDRQLLRDSLERHWQKIARSADGG
jgi:ribonuclease P protein component